MFGRDELVDNRRKNVDTDALAVLGRLDRQRRRVDQRRGDQNGNSWTVSSAARDVMR
jgi:hypothetical protein